MPLRDLFIQWCAVRGYFPEEAVYVRDTAPLQPQCARLVRLHSHIDEDAGNAQHYILEARFGASEIRYPLGHARRDIISMEAALRVELEGQTFEA